MKTSKRDIIIILIISVLVLIGFLTANHIIKNQKKDYAIVSHWHSLDNKDITDELVRIDFKNKTVKKLKNQVPKDGLDNYPIIEEVRDNIVHIKVIGEYTRESHNHEHEETIIEVDFIKNTVKIIQTNCPDQVCTGKLPVCIPNQIKVTFSKSSDDIDGIQ